MKEFLHDLKLKISEQEPKLVLESFDQNRGKVFSFVNPYAYNKIRLAENKILLNEIDGYFVDGILLVKMLSIIGVRVLRNSFDNTTVGDLVFNFCQKKGKGVYFIGAKEEEITSSIKNIKKHYPNLKIKGFRSGYFKENERDAVLNSIINSASDIVVVGMGSILQENFLIDLKDKGFNGLGFSCGGFLRQSAENYEFFPKYVNKLHLRWLYRMFKEEGILKRNLKTYPVFLWNFFNDFFGYD